MEREGFKIGDSVRDKDDTDRGEVIGFALDCALVVVEWSVAGEIYEELPSALIKIKDGVGGLD